MSAPNFPPKSEAPASRKSYRAKFAYTPEDARGVQLSPDDKLSDVVDAGNGWVVCYNKTTGKTGVCPREYLQRDMGGRIRSLSLSKFRNRVSSVTFNVASNIDIGLKKAEPIIEDGRPITEKPPSIQQLSIGQRILRILVGLLGGFLLGGLMFVALYYLYNFTLKEAAIVSGVITLVMGLCLIVSQHVRCVAVLMGVSVFTNQGRVALLSLVPGLILTGPIMNMHRNINEGVNSVACVGEVLYNHSRSLQHNTVEFLRRQQEILEEGEARINQKIDNLTTVDVFPGVFPGGGSSNTNTTQECIERVERERRECLEKTDTKKNESEGIFGILSGKVLPSTDLCSHLNVSVCTSSRRVARSVVANTQSSLSDRLKEELGFHVNISRALNISSNNSFNPAEKILEVKKKIQNGMDQVLNVFSLINKLLIIFIIWAFISSCFYLRGYLKKNKYDNVYITLSFKRLNSKLRKVDIAKAVLPLEKKERKKYVDSTSAKPGGAEAFAWKIGITRVIFHTIIAAFFILCDFALFYVLELIRQNGGSDVMVSGGAVLDVDIEGVGPLAELVRNIYAGNTASNNFDDVLNFQQCLPVAKAPSMQRVYTIIALYVTVLVFVFFQSYGLRLRRKITAFFFPRREEERVQYLYRHILLKRRVREEEKKKMDLLNDQWSPFLAGSEAIFDGSVTTHKV